MKATAPWIVALLLLALSPIEAFGRIANRPSSDGGAAARGGGGGAARNPVTNSRVSRPAQQPSRPAQRPAAQRPAQQPAQRPSVQRPTQRPAQPPAQRPSVQRPAQPPAQRPSVQRPAQPPAQRPALQRPAQLPAQRPAARPPVERPGNRPVARPETLPNSRPSIRPNERPATLPGNVTFPRPGDRPNISRPDSSRPGGVISRPGGAAPLPGNITRPGGGTGITRPGTTRPDGGFVRPDNSIPNITRPGGGIMRPDNTVPNISRPGGAPNRPGWGNDWGNSGNSGNWNRPGNRPNFNNNLNNNNININTNIRNNSSWSYRSNSWGSRPWWGTHHHHHWHHGSWCHGWGRSSSSFSSGFAWGVTAWTMGNWIFNSGYQNFSNPFPAPPVVNNAGITIISYTRPITVVAAELPPLDEAAELAASEKAGIAMEEALVAFRAGNFPTALTAVDNAISEVPGDPATHEFRALVFFAMGRFNDAAGVLNPILASGPGWDWTTMTGLFESQDEYVNLLRKLEEHQKANPDSAAATFLLGYHYLVLGHLEQALELFEHSAKLEPTDTVSAGLRDLLRESVTTEEDADAEDTPPPTPIDPDKLVGTWTSTVANDGTITLVMTKEGNFTWSFDKTGNNGVLTGEFGIYDSNLLVLISEDSQMAAEVTFAEDSKLSFVLDGGPRGDPGLTFVRKP